MSVGFRFLGVEEECTHSFHVEAAKDNFGSCIIYTLPFYIIKSSEVREMK